MYGQATDMEERTLEAARLVALEDKSLKEVEAVTGIPAQTHHYRLRIILPRLDVVLAALVDETLVRHRRADPMYLIGSHKRFK